MDEDYPVRSRDIAERFGVSLNTVYQWVQRKVLPKADWPELIQGYPAWRSSTIDRFGRETGRDPEVRRRRELDLLLAVDRGRVTWRKASRGISYRRLEPGAPVQVVTVDYRPLMRGGLVVEVPGKDGDAMRGRVELSPDGRARLRDLLAVTVA